MPTRLLREGILTSEKVNSLSMGAELFFRRLISGADDYGRFPAHPSLLLAALFPLKLNEVTTTNIQEWLGECEKAGVLVSYCSEGKECLEILRFKQRTRSPSKFPAPPSSVADLMTDTCQTNDGQMTDICQSNDRQMRPNANASSEAKSKTNTECEDEGVLPNCHNGPLRSMVDEALRNPKRNSGLVFDRDDPIGSVEKMVGPAEWIKNEGMWKKRSRENPRALLNALEDFAVRNPIERAKIRNRGAWLTKRYEQLAKGNQIQATNRL